MRNHPSVVGKRIRAEVADERRADLARMVEDGYPADAIERYAANRPNTLVWRLQEMRLGIADALDPDGADR